MTGGAIRFQPLDDPYLRRRRFSDSVLVLFVWYGLLVLTAVGNVNVFEAERIGQFMLIGSAFILLSGAALAVFWRRLNASTCVFACAVALAGLPVATLSPGGDERILLLDLYYVLLITAPVFFNLWQWQLQVVVAVLGLSAVGTLWIPIGAWTAVHSILLVFAAAVLSVLVAVLRARDPGDDSVRLEERGLELYARNASEHSVEATWNILLLQTCLLLVMIFFDVAFTGGYSMQPIVVKVYGLILLVFSGLMIKAISGVHVTRVLVSVTVMVGFILSVSRTGYGGVQNALFATPLVFLAFALLAAPWRLELQIAVVWGLLLSDLAAKCLAGFGVWGANLNAVGYIFEFYRGEILVLAVGSLGAVAACRSVQRQRAGNIAESVGLGFGGAAYLGDETESRGLGSSAHLQPFNAETSMGAVRRQALISGFLAPGIVSAIVSAQLLAMWGDSYRSVSVAYWFSFLSVLMLLVRADRRPHNERQFWVLAAFANLVLFMAPCILLLATHHPGYLYLYWPVGLVLAVGAIPWQPREVIPLLLAAVITGVELVYELNLGGVGVGIFVAAMLYSVISWLKNIRQLKEKFLLHGFKARLAASRGVNEVLETLADYLMYLFDSPWAAVSSSENSIEIVRGGRRHRLAADIWPCRPLWSQFKELGYDTATREIRAANWLTPPVGFLDTRFGIFSAQHGLAVQMLNPSEKAGGGDPSASCSYLFVKQKMPLFASLCETELRLAATIVDFSQLKLESLAAIDDAARIKAEAEARIQDREHELSSLVHDINNTVQDLTLLCEAILDNLERDAAGPQSAFSQTLGTLTADIKRIAVVARSMATVVSDAKRRRELERMYDLKPRELVEVTKVIKEIGLFAKIRAERKRITVNVPVLDEDSGPQSEIWVRVSVREHLETILRNLLNNAITYSNPGSLVEIKLSADDEKVTIDIVDNGPGLSEEEQREIFRKGYRGKTASGIPGGLGLGLAESRRVAETAGGSLTVHSAGEGKGSTFSVTLPRHHAPAQPAKGEKSWVLIVEDQPALSDFYGRLAKALELDPGIACSVPEAIAVVESRGRPTMVITDIHLGATSGLDLVRSMRQEFGESLPILVVSGLSGDSVADQARSAGATDFVAKPIGRRALFARIQSLLSQEGIG